MVNPTNKPVKTSKYKHMPDADFNLTLLCTEREMINLRYALKRNVKSIKHDLKNYRAITIETRLKVEKVMASLDKNW